MTFTSFLIILLAAYLFYYVIIIALDKMPSGKNMAQNGNVDFVFAPAERPAKIIMDESLKKYLPVTEDDNEAPVSGTKDPIDADCLQELMRMETYSDIAPEEIDGETLAGLMI